MELAGVAVISVAALAAATRRSRRLRHLVIEFGRGLTVLREPRRFLRRVLPWQIAGRLLRLASLGCFLHAFGLPAGPAVIVAVCVTQGSGRMLPIPGAGTAAAAAALLTVLLGVRTPRALVRATRALVPQLAGAKP